MEAVYKLKPSELNEKFLKLIKALYKDQEIEITISSTSVKGKGKIPESS